MPEPFMFHRAREHERPAFTDQQYRTLGKLVQRWAVPGNAYRFTVQAELGWGTTMLCIVEDTSVDPPMRLVHGIEPDGECHT